MDYRFRKLCILAFACSSIGAMAQVARSGLDGTVQDTSGRFIPGASITLVQTAPGLGRETVTCTKGSYAASYPFGVDDTLHTRWGSIPSQPAITVAGS
jgi:hypothetical protein